MVDHKNYDKNVDTLAKFGPSFQAKAVAAMLNSPDFYIGLDAIRFENISTINPVYGMTGYTVLKNTNAETIIKAANTSNYIEFRFALDVQ